MTATAPSARGRGQAGVLALACLILFVDGYDLFAIGTIGPSLMHHREWHPDSGTLGMLGSVTALGMPFGSILAGWAADRWGRRTPIAAAVTWISLSMLVAGLVPDLSSFAAARFCTGVGIGALAPLVGAYVTDSAPANRRTLHLAITMGAIGVGGTVSALLGRLLLPETPFQRLFLFGAVPIILVPLIWRVIPAGPPSHDAAHGRTPAGRNRVLQLLVPESRRTTVLFWVAAFMSMALVFSTTAWLPTVMMKSGYDLGSSLEFSIAFTLGASFGGLGVSLLGDRGRLKLVTFGCFLLAAVALFVLSTPQPRPLLLVMSALAGLGSLGCQNMVIACMTAFYPPRLRGTGLGVGLGVGRLGAIVGPTYLSIATDTFSSHRAGFFAFMVPAVLGAATIAMLGREPSASADPGATAKAVSVG
ncbi:MULTISPECIES: MFS transporter [Actinomadura]|uniref:MFS transporter n=1 Tax=Actinomadura yumaensis TaxID=111807 RepID=A0ABW2CIF3_9ACTN|nr:MFS transporter [Actinomadura sp. J1-007]MWK39943.1 MFS transporter [Actinomadura sp. J1-007]